MAPGSPSTLFFLFNREGQNFMANCTEKQAQALDSLPSACYYVSAHLIEEANMQGKNNSEQSLTNFFQDTLMGSEEEIKSIIETQKIVEELLESEEKPQIYQLQVISNW